MDQAIRPPTWTLAARKTSSPQPMFYPHPYSPTSTFAQAILRVLPLLTDLIIEREWLHDTAAQPSIPEATILEFYEAYTHTKSKNVHDAGRGDSRRSDEQEATKEACNSYMRIYALAASKGPSNFVNAPISHGEPPAYGSQVLQTPRKTKTKRSDGQLNRHRKLWKSTCTRAALNLPNLERTLYAALCPSPQTFPILRSACKTWEDRLWATLSVICEQRESAELDRLANYFSSFWEEQEQDGDDSGEPNSPPSLHPPPLPQLPHEQQELLTPNDESDWEPKFFQRSPRYKPPLFRPVLRPTMPFTCPNSILCLAERALCLTYSRADSTTGCTVLEWGNTFRFVDRVGGVFEGARGERHLIALGENAVERYALSLRLEAGMDEGMRIDGVDGGDSIEERKRALLRAREHVNRVAVVAAERSVDKAFELLPPTSTKGPLPSLVGPESDNPLQRPPSYIETFLVRSIEWATFSEATYATALEQACIVLHFFLAFCRLKLAQCVLDMLPAGLAGISEPEERATEYPHYRQFFLALEIDMDMSRIGSIGASRETRAAWLSDYHGVLEEANEQVTRLLTAEWLVNIEDYSAADKRRKEMIRVRRVFILEPLTRLHSLLYASRKWFPENLKCALNLANIIADSRYRLYDDFLGVDVDDELGPLQKQLEEHIVHYTQKTHIYYFCVARFRGWRTCPIVENKSRETGSCMTGSIHTNAQDTATVHNREGCCRIQGILRIHVHDDESVLGTNERRWTRLRLPPLTSIIMGFMPGSSMMPRPGAT
ncbi:hypothetical protein F5887DRAFT_1214057 [Amanita rubescens]|nr:hypothetical protein F5887DRAFT_1214057 [Amanita rubescens]